MANISGPRLVQLERAEKELHERMEIDILQPFVNDFVMRVGMLLAHTPYDKWPDMAKAALQDSARDAPTAYILYKSRLPKE